jgi:hypothetical protein
MGRHAAVLTQFVEFRIPLTDRYIEAHRGHLEERAQLASAGVATEEG